MYSFKNKVLLITGGTGTFGNAVVSRFIGTDIREVRIFSRDEKKQEDMRIYYKNPKLKFYLGDVRDYRSVAMAMRGVNLVFHAAALKQVPSCEFYPLEALKTNAIGAENVMCATAEAGVEKAIVLSTDKAVYPINAMGISKAMMEKLMVARARVTECGSTVICGTRYGNVMASRGSVIPLFIGQIKEGRPLTITDPEMTRFMMSIEDAVELVVYAYVHARPGDIFVQKAPAATIGVLAEALKGIFRSDVPVKDHRHSPWRKAIRNAAHKRGDWPGPRISATTIRIPADSRDLNYDLYFTEGEERVSKESDYNSHNTRRLSVDELAEKLLKLDVVQQALGGDEMTSMSSSPERPASSAGTSEWPWRREDLAVVSVDIGSPEGELERGLASCDMIFHLAGVNRPPRSRNSSGATSASSTEMLERLERTGGDPSFVLSSSDSGGPRQSLRPVQAPGRGRAPRVRGEDRDSGPDLPASRRFREVVPAQLQLRRGDLLPQHRPRPAYPDLGPGREIDLVHVDDVVEAFAGLAGADVGGVEEGAVRPVFRIALGDLAAVLKGFKESRETLRLADLSDPLRRRLFGTYVSYLPPDGFAYPVTAKSDARGELAELLKAGGHGQIFVSRTRPGVTRGNHYHDLKVEKFIVVEGEAIIRFRHISTGERTEYQDHRDRVPDRRYPPGLDPLHREHRDGRPDHAFLVERGLRSGPHRYVRRRGERMKKLRVMTVVGTRPEIIRLSRVIAALDRNFENVLVHTGQNQDYELNQIFFEDLEIRKPDHFLAAAAPTACEAIGRIVSRTDSLLRKAPVDALLVLGDTNSCLAAYAAKRNRVPVFHMEAGNRCFDERVPEEINRRIVDHIADINMPYSSISREYLLREGIAPDRIIKTGSPMAEVIHHYLPKIDRSDVLGRLELEAAGLFPGQLAPGREHRGRPPLQGPDQDPQRPGQRLP